MMKKKYFMLKTNLHHEGDYLFLEKKKNTQDLFFVLIERTTKVDQFESETREKSFSNFVWFRFPFVSFSERKEK